MILGLLGRGLLGAGPFLFSYGGVSPMDFFWVLIWVWMGGLVCIGADQAISLPFCSILYSRLLYYFSDHAFSLWTPQPCCFGNSLKGAADLE